MSKFLRGIGGVVTVAVVAGGVMFLNKCYATNDGKLMIDKLMLKALVLGDVLRKSAPLNAIGGYAELIEMGVRGPVTPETQDYLARIQRASRHLQTLAPITAMLPGRRIGSRDRMRSLTEWMRGYGYRSTRDQLASCTNSEHVLELHIEHGGVLMDTKTNTGLTAREA